MRAVTHAYWKPGHLYKTTCSLHAYLPWYLAVKDKTGIDYVGQTVKKGTVVMCVQAPCPDNFNRPIFLLDEKVIELLRPSGLKLEAALVEIDPVSGHLITG